MNRFAKVLCLVSALMLCMVSVQPTYALGGFLKKLTGGGESGEGGCSGPGCNLLKKFTGGEDSGPKEVQIVQVPAPEPAKKEDDGLPAWVIVALCTPFALLFAGGASIAAYLGVRKIQEG